MAASKLQILIETLYKGKGTKAATKDLKALEGQTKESTSKLDMMKGGLSKIALAAGTAGAALFAAKKAFDFGAEGAQIMRMRDVFDRLTESIDETASVVLGKMRDATMGMVSDSELMRASARTMSMGLASTGDEVAKLAEIAVKLGSAMGKEAGPAMEEFGLLLANTSTLRLDTFGISAGKVKARIIELRDATPGLTREAAFMTATMEQAEISMEKLGDAMKADAYSVAQAEMSNLTDEFKVFTSIALAPAVKGLGDFLKGLRINREIKALIKDLGKFGMTLGLTEKQTKKLFNAIAQADGRVTTFGTSALTQAKLADEFALALDLIAMGADHTTEEFGELVLEYRRLQTASENIDLVLKRIIERQEDLAEATEDTTEVTRALGGAYDHMIGPTAALSGAYDDQRFIAQKLTWQMGLYGDKLPGIREEQDKVTKATLEYRNAVDAAKRAILGISRTSDAEKQAIVEVWLDAQAEAIQYAQYIRDLNAEVDGIDEHFDPALVAIRELGRELDGLSGRNVEFSVTPMVGPPNIWPGTLGTPGVGQAPVGPPGRGFIPEEGPVTYPYVQPPEFQGGGRFTVPPGFHGRPFMMGVHSGEEVNVTPKGQDGGGGGTPIIINYYASGRGTSADAYDLATQIAQGPRG